MKRKFILSVSLLLSMIFVFSGCSLIDFFSADALLRAPGLTGENSALQSAVEAAVGKDISLYFPIAGDYRASYILFDANNDKKDEAVVFYSFNSNKSVVHMMLLSKNGDKWFTVADIIGSGTEVYKVDFCNIDTTQGLEIAVMWSLDDSKREKTLSLYKISSLEKDADNALLSVATIQLLDYICLDIDSDSINELLYFYSNSTDDQLSVSARLLDYIPLDSSFVPLSDVSLSLPITSVFDINYSKDNNDYLIFLDCNSPDGSFFTELIMFDYENSALSKPMVRDKYISSLSIRNNNISCRDFDNDGIIDIPCMLNYEASYVVGYSEESPLRLTFVNWFSYSSDEFYEIGKYFLNDFDGFSMKINDFYEYYYFVYDYENSVTQVRLKNYNEENNIVFSIISKTDSYDFNSLLQDENTKEHKIIISAKGESLSFTQSYIESLIEEY